MSHVDINIIYEIFMEARALHGREREELLKQRCASDARLREEVESLVQHDEMSGRSGALIETNAFSGVLSSVLAQAATEQREMPEMIGQYRIVRFIGEGGMGTVYEARQQRPDRRVALKVLRSTAPGRISRTMLRRFEQEAELLARLQHAGIAQIYEAGAHVHTDRPGDIQPFFAMEFIDGVSIAEHVGRHSSSSTDIIRLMTLVAEAVEHAHVRGVVHRDLKPANILVTAMGEPKVLDFGVARAMEQDARATSIRTDVGQLIGTLAYMSPEQISAGSGAAVDHRSDVYSLGVILYELLTGSLPHDVRGSSIAHAAQRIISDEPPRMSRFRKELRGDIDTIVRKAMDKDAARRYQSAAALAADLQRFLHNEPIAARPATKLYELHKFVQRNRAIVAGVALAIAALAIGATTSTVLALKENRLRVQANESQAASQRSAYRLAIAAADAAIASDPVRAMTHLEAAPPALRGWEWNWLHGCLDPVLASVASDRPEDGCAIAIGPNGAPLAAVVRSGVLEIIDLESRQVVTAFSGSLVKPRLSQDGTTIAALLASGHVVVFDAAGRELWRTPSGCTGLALSPDGRTILVETTDSRVQMYRVGVAAPLMDRQMPAGDHQTVFSFRHGSAQAIVHWIAQGRASPYLVFDAETGAETTNDSPNGSGDEMVDIGDDRVILPIQRMICIFDRATGQTLQTFAGHMKPPSAFAISPDGALLASSAADHTLRVWDIATGVCRVLVATHLNANEQRWTSDGHRILAAYGDGSVRMLSVLESPELVMKHSSYVYHAVFSPDGKYVASGGWNGEVRLWDAANGRLIASLMQGAPNGSHPPAVLGFGRDGSDLVIQLGAGEVYRWNIERAIAGDLTPRISPESAFPLEHLATLTPAARRTRFDGGQIIAMSPDRATFAVAENEDVRLVDAKGTILRTFRPSPNVIRAVAFSPDGETLAAAGEDAKIYLIEVRSGIVRRTLVGHRDTVYSVAFSPDGTRIASGGNDNLVIIWDSMHGDPLLDLHRHSAYVHAVSFSPDGSSLVSASGDGTVRIWPSSKK